MLHSEHGEIRPLNVVVRPGSKLHRAYAEQRAALTPNTAATATAATTTPDGFHPRPQWDLKPHGGRTIADLVFVNRFLGGAAAWDKRDVDNIDLTLEAAMSDPTLQAVMAQYYHGPITSTMLPSDVVEGARPAGSRFFKDDAEALAAELFSAGVLGDNDPAQSVVNMMLPRGVILVDDFSPGFRPAAGDEETHGRRTRALIKVDDDASDSTVGLGGYHGSVHVPQHGQTVTCYYAVGVFSEGANGIPVFGDADHAWANVVATFYHELNEARTDPDVEDAIRLNDISKIGWYSETGRGEIGDLPISETEPDLTRVFRFVALTDGSSEVPVQLMWSNKAHAPASR
ncbi:hypothetical protein [Kitasatospora sp. MMS16-BH015]|uniref:hypothetical protein n=1 Tax=Kitasatospora sp. MMS16-BH015 TaxID=2018025 RepID=UPI000CF274BF|nr:hypothetical protein [Kitasatospora sp. MMS16-BH015]